MKRIFTLLLLATAYFTNAQTNFDPSTMSPLGYWMFEDANNLGHATVGTDLTVVNGTGGNFTQVAGPSANDHAIHKSSVGSYLACAANIVNGGGTRGNQYSIMMDISVPALVSWNSLLDMNPIGNDDGELYLKNDQLGSGQIWGWYTGGANVITANTWYRYVVTVDLTAPADHQAQLYINGVQWMDGCNKGVDHTRVSLESVIRFLGDPDAEEAPIDLGQIAIWDYALTANQVADMGAPIAPPTPTNFDPVAMSPLGFWMFEDATNLGHATIGTDLTVVNGAAGNFTQVAGPNSTDKAIHKSSVGSYLACAANIVNGGGTRGNQYSIMMDFSVPALVGWNSLLDMNPIGNDDGELYLKNGSIGSGQIWGAYSGNAIAANEYHRLVVTVDLTAAVDARAQLYVDGVKWMDGCSKAVDHARVSLDPNIRFLGDPDAEEAAIDISQLAIWDYALTMNQVAGLGGFTLANSHFDASSKYSLKVYPNPIDFNSNIAFTLPSASSNVKVQLFDITGREIQTIFNGNLGQGEQNISWNVNNKFGAGTYFVRVNSDNGTETIPVLLK